MHINIRCVLLWLLLSIGTPFPCPGEPLSRSLPILNPPFPLTQGWVSQASAAIGPASFTNFYGFLCSAGFAMVFTRILTLNDLQPATYYSYRVFYNLIYIVPLMVNVILFSITPGAKKLQERQGRILKRLSGTMMLGLGVVLLVPPNWLNNAVLTVLLLVLALLVTFLITLLERRGSNRVISK